MIKQLMPVRLKELYRKIKRYVRWKKQMRLYSKEVERLSGTKEPLNVVFLVLSSSVWKYDSVYQLMEKDRRFNPIILVCPAIDIAENESILFMNNTYDYFRSKGYNVVKACNDQMANYVDIETLSPDILFYGSQWNRHYAEQYRTTTLQNKLKCIVNYSFKNMPNEWSIATAVHGSMWMYFSECEYNMQLVQSYNPREFKNVHVVGYPMYDEIQALQTIGKDWKIQDKKHKRIIWAPHHSIEGRDGLVKFSTFLLYESEMRKIAKKYEDTIQFAFKPHPELKSALYHHADWGVEKTDAYYDWWSKQSNTTLVEGAYADLFKSSDAMIHDCTSFTVEYLYVNKPVMFLDHYQKVSQSSEIGKMAFSAHYHGSSLADIEHFIEDVVQKGEDERQVAREVFYRDILVPPHGKSVTENIIDEISKALNI